MKTQTPNDLIARRTFIGEREGTTMLLLQEALARSRQQEAIQAAERHTLARQVAAGRTWSVLARFAARRAARARAAAGLAPLEA
jgi:hypothetical protein